MTSSSSLTMRGSGAERWGQKTPSPRSAPLCTPSGRSVSLGRCRTRRTLPGPTTAPSGVGWTRRRSVRCGELVWQFVLQQQPHEVKNVSCIHSRHCWWGGWFVDRLRCVAPHLTSPHRDVLTPRRERTSEKDKVKKKKGEKWEIRDEEMKEKSESQLVSSLSPFWSHVRLSQSKQNNDGLGGRKILLVNESFFLD